MRFKVCGVDCETDKQTLTAGEVLTLAWQNEALVYKPTNGTDERYYKLSNKAGHIFEWNDLVQLEQDGRYHIVMFGRCGVA